MQVLMNKKNSDRIFRKHIKSIETKSREQYSGQMLYSFRSTGNNNINLLKNPSIRKTRLNDDDDLNFALLKRFKVPEKFSELAKPKLKFANSQTKQKIHKVQNNLNFVSLIPKINNKRNSNARTQKNLFNKTISYFKQPNNIRISLFDDLQLNQRHQEFQRKQRSVKKQLNKKQQTDLLTKNTICSSKIGKLSTYEILQIKKQWQFKKDILMGVFKTGQRISNQQLQSEQMRQIYALFPDTQRKKIHLLQEHQHENQHLDKQTLDKYRKLLDTIHVSEDKYDINTYQHYDLNLTQKNITNRRKKTRSSKINNNCAEQWR